MSKELTLSINGHLVPISIDKIDRSDLYGQTLCAMIDGAEQCSRVQVLIDGTILGPKSTKSTLSIDGLWIEEQDTKRYTPEGREMVKQESSFKSAPACMASNITELLDYCIKSVYLADGFTGEDQRLEFNYTLGYHKPAFLLEGADGNGYMLIGEPAQCSWVGHQDFNLTGDTEEWTEEDMEEMFG